MYILYNICLEIYINKCVCYMIYVNKIYQKCVYTKINIYIYNIYIIFIYIHIRYIFCNSFFRGKVQSPWSAELRSFAKSKPNFGQLDLAISSENVRPPKHLDR